ncbi:MAG: hypothetical protein ACRECN_04020, partial [Methylocella sp.]
FNRVQNLVMLSFFVMAAFFGLLMTFVADIHLLLLLYCLYLLVDIWMWKLRRDEIGAAVEEGNRFLRDAVPPEKEGEESSDELRQDRLVAGLYGRAIESLRSYYFDRYHIGRIIATLAGMAVLCVAAYAVSGAGTHSPAPLVTYLRLVRDGGLNVAGFRLSFDVARFVAYLLFLSLLFGSELVIGSWRNAMRNQLYDVRDSEAAFLRAQRQRHPLCTWP